MDSAEQKSGQPLVESYFFRSPEKRRLIFCLLLALATIALYNSVTRAPFLNFDDQVYVTDNPQVRAGLTWNTVVWAFRTPKAFDWHPITWISYAVFCLKKKTKRWQQSRRAGFAWRARGNGCRSCCRR